MIINYYEYITSLSIVVKVILKIDKEVALTISCSRLFQQLIVCTP